MATYLQLVNRVLRRMNEVEVVNVSGNRGFTAAVSDYVNDAIRDINNAELKWPFNYAAGSQTLIPSQLEYELPTHSAVDRDSFVLTVPEELLNSDFETNTNSWNDVSSGTGDIFWNSYGNGVLVLNAGVAGEAVAEQSVDLISGSRYRIETRVFDGSVTLKVGTASGLSDILAVQTLDPAEPLRGQFYRFEFVASGNTAFVTVSSTANADRKIDFISVKETQFSNKHLTYKPYNIWLREHKERELNRNVDELMQPVYVTLGPNGTFIVWPKTSTAFIVTYDYWSYPNDLTGNNDVPTIPTRFDYLITEQALYYCHHFREDFETAAIKEQKVKKGIERMRIELINKDEEFQGSGHL